MAEYSPQIIEKKWQEHWTATGAFEVTEDPSRPAFYCLEMFAYPSGRAHVGHVRNYMIGDVVARLKRMQGANVLHPFGWDAFGLPAENAAIKNNLHPEQWTLDNIAYMKGQLQRLGISYAWGRELATCLPDYYHWNQWLFIRMFERDLAYRRRSTVNWCPSCLTVLANEQVVDGACWRCGTHVTSRELEQWFLRITHYAEELLEGTHHLPDWPEKVLTMQRNWIGKSEGVQATFPIADDQGRATSEGIEIFTTRIDTIYGATFVLIAPEHELVERFAAESIDPAGFRRQAERFRQQDRLGRMSGEVEKEGFDTGRRVMNPFTGETVPVWVANFVLGGYGTGAIMAVPAHDQRDFEFARKYGLPVQVVVKPVGGEAADDAAMIEAFTEYGESVNSDEFTGLPTNDAWQRMAASAEARGIGKTTIQYRLKDWGVSRQRYWGTPIPMIHCPSCGVVPVPDDQLPVVLPKIVEFTGKGESPLAQLPEFVNVSCPACGGAARRETDTMDTFVDSSWYYYRFTRREQRSAGLRSREVQLLGARRLLQRRRRARHPAPDLLAVLRARVPRPRHGLARRAVHAAADAGHGAQGRTGHVEVQGQRRRSRRHDREVRRRRAAPLRDVRRAAREGSRVERHRARGQLPLPDTRVAIRRSPRRRAVRCARGRGHRGVLACRARASPQDAPDGCQAHRRPLPARAPQYRHFRAHGTGQRTLRIRRRDRPLQAGSSRGSGAGGAASGRRPARQTLAAAREAVSALVRLLSPFAPHMAEELWEMLGNGGGIVSAGWPGFDADVAAEEAIEMPVQVNGKVRGRVTVPAGSPDDVVQAAALADPNVRAHIDGKTIVKVIVAAGRLVSVVVK